MQTITICALILAAVCAVSAYDHVDYHAHIPYKYEYGVKDGHTGDHKSAWEHGDGHGGVKGSFTLEEADGTHRVVEYHGDPKAGTNTIVKRVGHAHHPHHGTSYQNQNLDGHI